MGPGTSKERKKKKEKKLHTARVDLEGKTTFGDMMFAQNDFDEKDD